MTTDDQRYADSFKDGYEAVFRRQTSGATSFLQLFKIWRERVGIEPTQRNFRYAATDLKSGAATRHASAPAKSSI